MAALGGERMACLFCGSLAWLLSSFLFCRTLPLFLRSHSVHLMSSCGPRECRTAPRDSGLRGDKYDQYCVKITQRPVRFSGPSQDFHIGRKRSVFKKMCAVSVVVPRVVDCLALAHPPRPAPPLAAASRRRRWRRCTPRRRGGHALRARVALGQWAPVGRMRKRASCVRAAAASRCRGPAVQPRRGTANSMGRRHGRHHGRRPRLYRMLPASSSILCSRQTGMLVCRGGPQRPATRGGLAARLPCDTVEVVVW